VARLAGAQPVHPSLSPRLGSGAQEFSSIKKGQRVLVPGLVSFFFEIVVRFHLTESTVNSYSIEN
jgi:hypothetical protein